MKFAALLLLAAASLTTAAQNIRPTNVDFKTISTATTANVVIINDTDHPIVISAIKGDCSCVSAKFSKAPIHAGQHIIAKVTYTPRKGESGLFYKVVRVEYGAKKTPTEFTLRGVVKR